MSEPIVNGKKMGDYLDELIKMIYHQDNPQDDFKPYLEADSTMADSESSK
jgi:hypothetical protein